MNVTERRRVPPARVGLLGVMASLLMVYDAAAIPLTGPIVNPTTGNTYYLLDAKSWVDSETEANSLGGHLVTVNDQSEQDWVFSTFGFFGGINRSLWIGLTDMAIEGTFVWISGQPVAYTNWATDEPNDNVNEDFVHMYRTNNGFSVLPGKWNDLAAGINLSQIDPIHGVVEVLGTGGPGDGGTPIPEPTSMLLLGSGLAALGLTRRRQR